MVSNLRQIQQNTMHYSQTTAEITVTVRPVYLDGKSDFFENRYVFAYFIKIQNKSAEEVQLLRRRWTILDKLGGVEEVEGAGVVGQMPIIPPNSDYEYHSFCVLKTFEGTMEGKYLMQKSTGERFYIDIPLFHLKAMVN
jgi:ApaG protein